MSLRRCFLNKQIGIIFLVKISLLYAPLALAKHSADPPDIRLPGSFTVGLPLQQGSLSVTLENGLITVSENSFMFGPTTYAESLAYSRQATTNVRNMIRFPDAPVNPDGSQPMPTKIYRGNKFELSAWMNCFASSGFQPVARVDFRLDNLAENTSLFFWGCEPGVPTHPYYYNGCDYGVW